MNKKGFTLIELLVVIAIIALLSTLAVVALGSARQKSRDAKRVSDIKQIQTALELYFTDKNGYPAGSGLKLGGTDTKCLDSAGFVAIGTSCTANAYMNNIPADPSPTAAGYDYTLTATGYSITFTLEGATGGLPLGLRTASPAGVQ